MSLMHMYREPALTDFRTQYLLAMLKTAIPQIIDLRTEWCFNVDAERPLIPAEQAILDSLLAQTFEPEKYGFHPFLGENGLVLEFGPNRQTETSWSSNLVSACHASGLGSIKRIESSQPYED